LIGEFNKIFDRDFVIGFFAPSLAFVMASLYLLRYLGVLPAWLSFDGVQTLKDATTLAFASWVWAMFLLSINRGVFRFIEGYWPFGLAHHLNGIERRRFIRLQTRLAALERQEEANGENNHGFCATDEKTRLLEQAARRFPGTEDLVLPTSFGNVVRAFEDYPRIMYGYESIDGWNRLYTVLPKDYREVMNSARALTDFWVNLWFMSLLFVAEVVAVTVWTHRLIHVFIIVLVIIFSIWTYIMARDAVARWGEWVKAAFDVFLPELGKKLGYVVPTDREQEREFWLKLSQAMVFRDPGALDDIVCYRQAASPDPQSPEESGDRQGSKK